jgi:ubiquitin-conjugating enzyme (huntingtin interacting protein 2)
LQSLLSDPAPNDPQDAVVAKHYISDRADFDRVAMEWTALHAVEKVVDERAVSRLMEMGFERPKVIDSLLKFKGNEQEALEFMLA